MTFTKNKLNFNFVFNVPNQLELIVEFTLFSDYLIQGNILVPKLCFIQK